MEKMIAVCGLNCLECDAFIATKNNDDALKKSLAEKWSQDYKHDFKPADIDCVGCRTEGKHIGYCGVCGVRKCGLSKGIANCALCDIYPDCEILNDFFKLAPEEGVKKIKNNLEDIRAGR